MNSSTNKESIRNWTGNYDNVQVGSWLHLYYYIIIYYDHRHVYPHWLKLLYFLFCCRINGVKWKGDYCFSCPLSLSTFSFSHFPRSITSTILIQVFTSINNHINNFPSKFSLYQYLINNIINNLPPHFYPQYQLSTFPMKSQFPPWKSQVFTLHPHLPCDQTDH